MSSGPRETGSDDESDENVFVCSTCGRSDLPETGGWDPPICLECDAQLNFDAEQLEHWSG